MHHRRLAYPLLVAVSLCAFSPAARKEGVRVTVTGVGADSVALSVTGSLMNVVDTAWKYPRTGKRSPRGTVRAARYTADAPFHTATPVQLMPLSLQEPLKIVAVGGGHIKVVVDNMFTHQHLEAAGRSVQISRDDDQTQIKLTSTP